MESKTFASLTPVLTGLNRSSANSAKLIKINIKNGLMLLFYRLSDEFS
jgi:hypothetical protein